MSYKFMNLLCMVYIYVVLSSDAGAVIATFSHKHITWY